ncbi:MAG TPA: DUF5700 domain-containing putative Zn-dependent protease [Candidatus Xenobia bacterium]|nr:DUF5700 domain-containing putative Zn-dependent protease [Candidatus Xenobia bacterium]
MTSARTQAIGARVGSVVLVLFLFLSLSSTHASATRVWVELVTDEADAVLAILAKKAAAEPVTDADWERLFNSDGYVRLKKREASLNRGFTDDDFKAFVLSDELSARRADLEETLARWKQADLNGAAGRALAYLPEGADFRAKVYPVIKPQTNSFVFEVTTDPAIFLYLDPTMTAAQFENTMAHELHHIGYAGACASRAEAEQTLARSPAVAQILRWIGAFGEGVAMLAAAGGPDVHPHAASPEADRQRWDRDVIRFDDDLGKVEAFFLSILDGRLTNQEDIDTLGFSFFGIQGPWYTVGWKMAVTIENTYGRAALIDCLCEPARFLATYNRAAEEQMHNGGERLATWSPKLMEALLQVPENPAGGAH